MFTEHETHILKKHLSKKIESDLFEVDYDGYEDKVFLMALDDLFQSNCAVTITPMKNGLYSIYVEGKHNVDDSFKVYENPYEGLVKEAAEFYEYHEKNR